LRRISVLDTLKIFVALRRREKEKGKY